MSRYRVYKSPNGDIVRVKMGFSWRAFFVGPSRLWSSVLAALAVASSYPSALLRGSDAHPDVRLALVLVAL